MDIWLYVVLLFIIECFFSGLRKSHLKKKKKGNIIRPGHPCEVSLITVISWGETDTRPTR